MHSVSVVRFVLAVGIVASQTPAMHGAVQDRIVGDEGTKGVALVQSVPPRMNQANGVTDLGVADGATALGTMTVRFNMTEAQKVVLSQLLIDQQNPTSAKYRQWLTPEQYAAQFGLSKGDVATVSRWLTGQGFTITSTARSRTFIQFSGTVAQAQTAFNTSIHKVSVDVGGKPEEHITNVSEVVLPSGIAGVVASVSGLNDFRLKPRAKVRQVQASDGAKFTSSISGNHYIAPGDFYTIYDVKPLLASSINGSGLTIAVAGQTDIALSDIAAFRSASGLAANPPTVKLYGADPGTSSGDEPEADLDVEWSGAVAPSATILYVNSKDVIGTSLTQIIDNKLAPIATVSYGDCEANFSGTDLNSLNSLFMQANAQGMTVVGPGGDSGATDCDYTPASASAPTTSATHGLAVDFPASSPYVTALGGTEFDEGAGTYFGATNDSNGGSALSYIPEMVWNDTAADIANGGSFSAGGGGASAFFTKPYWQTGTGVPNDLERDVPDVSLNASADHDGYLFCTGGSCTNGFRASDNSLAVVGGTSVSAPSFAGILALVEQKIGSTTGIGNANPTIYALANSTYYATAFHDVTVGNNDSPCTAGSTGCPSGGSIGYSAGIGYDQATGWGSVDAFNLANSWTLVTPGTSSAGTQPSTTTVTESAASVTSGTTVTLTATVANGGTAPGVQSPTGTVQFLVDNVAVGGTVTLSGSVGTYSLATTTLASGSHTISANYSGDSIYAGSIGTTTLDVTSATTADFTLTPATATVTTKSGTDAAGIVFTVTPVNGFTGTVTFSAGTTSSTLAADGNASFNPLSVSITSTVSGTTTLVLSAYVPNAKTGTGLLRFGTAGTASAMPPGRKNRWYAGSGAALAFVVLLMVPKRRRFGALLGALLSIAALGGMAGLSGCGSTTSTITTNTNVPAGTYTVSVIATGTTTAGAQVTHTSTVTFVVQ